MKEIKASKLRELTREEVELRLQDLQEELQNLRFRASLKQEGNPLRIRALRQALRWFSELDRIIPGLPSTHQGCARCYYGMYDFEKAAEHCEKYLAFRENDIAAWRFLALIRRHKGDTQGAVTAYERVAERQPGSLMLQLELVEVLMTTEGLSRAASVAQELAASFDKKELTDRAYRLYEKFRPVIPPGRRGWGAKGELALEVIRSLKPRRD